MTPSTNGGNDGALEISPSIAPAGLPTSIKYTARLKDGRLMRGSCFGRNDDVTHNSISILDVVVGYPLPSRNL